MTAFSLRLCGIALLISTSCSVSVVAQDTTTDIGTLDSATAAKVFAAKPAYSPYVGRNFPTRPLFGDTHLLRLRLSMPVRLERG